MSIHQTDSIDCNQRPKGCPWHSGQLITSMVPIGDALGMHEQTLYQLGWLCFYLIQYSPFSLTEYEKSQKIAREFCDIMTLLFRHITCAVHKQPALGTDIQNTEPNRKSQP